MNIRENVGGLVAFLAVARVRNFTRAAAELGVSQPALSHTIRELETRLGARLLSRTTRSVAPTEAGERLLKSIAPHFDAIAEGLSALTELRDRPAGTLRITAPEHAAETVLWPALSKFLPDYPDINLEIVTEHSLTNIVTEQFDAGVRFGEHIEKDMVAIRIGPEVRMAVVGSPSYFAHRPKPKSPEDLTLHRCINLRRVTRGGFYPWEFENAGREIKVRVEGQLVFTSLSLIREAALAGLGLAYLPEDQVLAHIRDKRLFRVLGDWCEPFPGYYLYYPSRRQQTPAFTLMLNSLRHRPPKPKTRNS